MGQHPILQRCLLCVLTSQHFNPASAGLFFCLASAEGAGLLFLPGGVLATYNRLQRPFCRPCNYTTTTPKAFTGLYSGVPVDLTYSNERNTAATQAAYTNLHPAGWHTVKRCTCTDTRYHRHAGRCTDQHSRPIIIRYIRMQRRTPVIDPCPAVQHSADHASGSGLVHPACILCRGQPSGWRSGTGQQSGRTGSTWHPPPGGAVQQRAARNH